MSIITRHITGEFIKVFLAALGAVMAVLILSDAVKELQNRGFGPLQIALILPYLAPFAAKNAMQGALLFAACCVHGRFAASNELLAIKAAGISPLRVVWPLVALTLPLSFLSVSLDELDATWGRMGIRRVLATHVKEVVYGVLRRQRVIDRGEFNLVVMEVRGRTLIAPVLTLKNGNNRVTIAAEEGELESRRSPPGLRIVLHHGRMLSGEYQGSFADTIEQEIPLEVAPGEPYSLARCIRQQHVIDDLTRQSQEASAVAGGTAAAGDWSSRLSEASSKLARLETQWLHKWANGFCCFCFVAAGAPAAMLLRSGSWLMSFFVCFLPIILVYQPLHGLGIFLAEQGYMPPPFVIGVDLLLAGVGIVLLRRIVRY